MLATATASYYDLEDVHRNHRFHRVGIVAHVSHCGQRRHEREMRCRHDRVFEALDHVIDLGVCVCVCVCVWHLPACFLVWACAHACIGVIECASNLEIYQLVSQM